MPTVREIITRALGELMYTAEGEIPSASAIKDGLSALNDMIADWHNDNMLFTFPVSSNWRGAWDERVVYKVNDAVNRAGTTYLCAVAHTSAFQTTPGTGPDQATYWTVTTDDDLTLSLEFPWPHKFHRGIISMLAVEMGPQFNIVPNALTIRKAKDGETALLAAYLPILPVGVDYGLTRMPSQVWPYTVGSVE